MTKIAIIEDDPAINQMYRMKFEDLMSNWQIMARRALLWLRISSPILFFSTFKCPR